MTYRPASKKLPNGSTVLVHADVKVGDVLEVYDGCGSYRFTVTGIRTQKEGQPNDRYIAWYFDGQDERGGRKGYRTTDSKTISYPSCGIRVVR